MRVSQGRFSEPQRLSGLQKVSGTFQGVPKVLRGGGFRGISGDLKGNLWGPGSFRGIKMVSRRLQVVSEDLIGVSQDTEGFRDFQKVLDMPEEVTLGLRE